MNLLKFDLANVLLRLLHAVQLRSGLNRGATCAYPWVWYQAVKPRTADQTIISSPSKDDFRAMHFPGIVYHQTGEMYHLWVFLGNTGRHHLSWVW